ncbi:helix-turn-helix domain-containing protein [Cupriavidus sp. BIC8F]|uniref:HVO_A0114 family putative DNA-binding protein n=1 Tax=Cupriavidus sp. BIC8F TaxID=3079014 RepID=UPI0029169BE4|nr:helix-turn-helix domain-containing protein [Cupriavidus sp. BIC8F]
MTKLIIKTGTEADFFKRGRELARMADRAKKLPDERTISFEDPADVLKLITAARLALFHAVKERPGSITEIAERLHRDRSAVKRDVDELAHAGLVTVAEKVLPGHGRMKEVRAAAVRVHLHAEVA